MNKKFDIGIYGLWYGNNYGSQLTYYALKSVVENMGYSVSFVANPLGKADLDKSLLPDYHAYKFAERNNYSILPYYKISEMKKLNELCEGFILGSDQMWNYGLSKPYQQTYFLDFANDDACKISYATSFGKNEYIAPVEYINNAKDNLCKMGNISVRDRFSKSILKKTFNVESEVVMDPVFLCEKEDFGKVLVEPNDKKYILAYLLNPDENAVSMLRAISSKYNKKIYVVLDLGAHRDGVQHKLNCGENIYDILPTAEEFLGYIKNAEFILSDSFHGACFSYIFKKQFIVKKNQFRGKERFDELSFNLGETNPFVASFKEMENLYYHVTDTNKELIDYNNTSEHFYNAINKSKEWLENAIDSSLIKNSVKKIVNHNMCTGCGACQYICNKGAIRLEKNTEGFLIAKINSQKCVNCGLCLKKCIMENPNYVNEQRPECYAMMAKDEIRKISSSGGMFTVIANYIIENGGYVCGAAYNNDFSVKHIIVNNKSELYKLRGSKYMQSNASVIYADIKKLLDKDELVLFSGMPCQVAGLYSFLGKEYNSLYTIDLLCHGITSSKVFEKYHKDILDGKMLSRLEFKEKEPWGWHAGVNAYFIDGSKYSKPLESDLYFISYLKSISKNTSCGVCKLNKLPRQGDLTIGDFWGIAKEDPSAFDGKGTSVVLLNNEKGKRITSEISDKMKLWKKESLDAAIRGNRIIVGPYRLHKNRDLFFKEIDNLDFRTLTLGCYENKLYKYQKEKLLKIIPEENLELFYLAKAAAEYSNGRKIITWIKSQKFENILNEFFNLEVEFAVAKNDVWIDNKFVFPLSVLEGKSGEYYVVALDPNYSPDLYGVLNSYGYLEDMDFIFRRPNPIILENIDLAGGRYEDTHGNTIEGYSGRIEKIIFRGGNNHIVVGNNNVGLENLSFDLTANTYIEIGNNNRFYGNNRFVVLGYNGNSEIKITNKIRLTDALYRVYNSPNTSAIYIGDECTFETNLELHANSGKKIKIGQDCMFSHDIDLWAGDGHSIFDVETGKNINSLYDESDKFKNEINIGNHVWISKGAFIMHGTRIETGSVVGAKSVVKGKYPNNCSIAGNPAKIIKKNIAWSRDMVTNDINRCGKDEYVSLTVE